MTVWHILLLAAVSIMALIAAHGEEIINGKKAKKNSLKYMASVQLYGKHICGGFLINPSYVLTAAHCEIKNLDVVVGTQNIDPKKTDLERYKVKSMHPHPSYVKGHLCNGFDIMLLKLSKKVSLNKSVKLAKIPSKGLQVKSKLKCQVAGWGKTETQESVNDLLVAEVSTINITDCKKQWSKVKVDLPANVLCAGGYRTKSGACQGDSGGPLVCKDLVVGIVSFNYKLNCNYPNFANVYTEISQYTAWIDNIIKGGA